MAQARITLRDVARQVGVHPSTVSRVLNPDTRGMVTDEIARRVEDAVDRLGYRPNPIAYSLKTNRSLTVGVMVPDLTNPLFPPIIRGIEDGLVKAGYTAIVANSDNDQTREQMIVDRMRGRRVDGLILATAHRDDPIVAECLAEKLPLVLVNRQLDDDNICSVVSDDDAGIRASVAHVIALGHCRIAHIAGPQDTSTGHARYQAFVAALAEHDTAPAGIAFGGAYSIEAGRTAMSELLRETTPDAVIAANDMMAVGVYEALEARGMACPGDVSVTGFNDMPFVDKLSPPLTTVRIPHYRMGAEAAAAMLKLMDNDDACGGPIVLPPELIVRGSTAAAR